MWGLTYIENGEWKVYEEEFEGFPEAEKIARQMGLQEFKIIPISSERIDFSKGIFDF